MTGFLLIVEALVAGYLAAIAVYGILLLLMTRLGRAVLMRGNCASSTYTALHTLVWGIAAAVGAYVCYGMAPTQFHGIGVAEVLAVALALVAVRSFRQLSCQMSGLALASNLVAVAAGTALALYAHGAFAVHA